MDPTTLDSNLATERMRRSFVKPQDTPDENIIDVIGNVAVVTNSVAAGFNSAKFRKNPVNTVGTENLDYTPDNIRNILAERGYSVTVQDDAISSTATNWTEVIQRANYLKDIEERESRFGNYSNFEKYGIGLATALIDVDTLAYTPLLKGAKLVSKAVLSSPATAASRMVNHTAAGGTMGLVSNVTMENTTGVYHEDSNINSALIGMGIGGTLGFFINNAGKMGKSQKYFDKDGHEITATEARNLELDEKILRQERLDEAIDIARKNQAAEKQAGKDIDKSQVADRNAARQAKRDQKGILQNAKDVTLDALGKARDVYTVAANKVTKMSTEISKLNSSVAKAKKDVAAKAELDEAFVLMKREAAPIKGQITKLTKQLEGLSKKRSKEAALQRKEINKKLEKKNTELRKIKRRQMQAEVRLSKLNKDAAEVAARGEKKVAELENKLERMTRNLAKHKKNKEAANKNYSKAVKDYNDYSTRVSKEEAPDSVNTKDLKSVEEMLKVANSPEGLAALLKQQKVVGDDINKLLDEDLTIERLETVQSREQNLIDKLSDELDAIEKNKSLIDTEVVKKYPYLKWMLVTPGSKLLTSINEGVAGFASKIVSPVIYMGRNNVHNATAYKELLDVAQNKMFRALTEHYQNAKKDGSFMGKPEEFEAMVHKEHVTAMGGVQREAATRMNGALDFEARTIKSRELSETLEPQYSSQNPHVVNAAKAVHEYYSVVRKQGVDVEHPALLNTSKAYVNRNYDSAKIAEIDRQDFIDDLVDAQLEYASTMNKPVPKALEKEWAAKADDMYTEIVDGDIMIKQLLTEFGAHVNTKGSGLRQRKLEVFDDRLAKYLSDDVRGGAYRYGRKAHGSVALMRSTGMHNSAQIGAAMKELGATAKEMDYMKAIIEDLLGVRQVAANPRSFGTRAIKAFSGVSTAAHVMNFGLNTVSEFSQRVARGGFANIFRGTIGDVRNVRNIWKNGTPLERSVGSEFVKTFDPQSATRVSRFFEDDTIDSFGKGQQTLDKINQKLAKWGGTPLLTDVIRFGVASDSVVSLGKAATAKNLTRSDKMWLQEMGFDPNNLTAIRKNIVKKDGTFELDPTKWDSKFREDFELGLVGELKRKVIEPDASQLPLAMTDFKNNLWIPHLAGKFLRFPLASFEPMVIRGLQYHDAAHAVALGTNLAIWSGILLLKDAMLPEDKQEFIGNDDDGMQKLFTKSLIYNSYAGLPTVALDTVAGLTTGRTTQGYTYQPFGSPLSDWKRIASGHPTFSAYGKRIDLNETFQQIKDVSMFGDD